MVSVSRQPQDDGPGRTGPGSPLGSAQTRRWAIAVVAVVLIVLFIGSGMFNRTSSKAIDFSQFQQDLTTHQIKTANFNNSTGAITGTLSNGTSYTTTGPTTQLPDSIYAELKAANIKYTFSSPSSNVVGELLLYLLPVALIIGFFVWMSRRAQGQMSGIMSIGRSRAKVYTAERPRTTFDDVAGYQGVKQEISEVVDFLKSPGRFKEIGARVPKGVLLVGPPGTGKTLLARAVAGEAGVPFLSVSGSDFMEMFVGVGASRVRDLFQTARKQAPAIIFVDEIDSIGRKRGAGLGGGHDEREQTLNQMLNEMDGFDVAEGIVVMAATNRPDILDPALLRPGRFDRQIVVPLPDLDERLPILQVHCKDKRMGPDLDLSIIARGTPGMSGADLANLVNEAALHAVRRGSQFIEMRDFDAARDRILMGQPRDSMVLSGPEKARVAFHEGGHAVLAYVLTHADPLLKGEHHPDGPRPRGHPAASDRGEAHLPPRVHRGRSRRPDGRARGRDVGLRRPFHRGERRPPAQHRAGAQDGPRVGHVRARGADGLGIAGHGLPRGGPHAHPRLLRGHEPGCRRGGRQDPPGAGGPGHRRAAGAQGWSGGGRTRLCSSSRRSTVPRSAGSSTPPTASLSMAETRAKRSSATERYAPSLSGGVMAQSAPGLSSTGIPPDHMLALGG